MDRVEENELTERQRYWLEQVRACEASGKTVAEYAAEQGFSASAMYAGKQTLIRKGVLPRTPPSRFQRVQIAPIPAGDDWRIQLPNGVSVAFSGEVDSAALAIVLNTAATLR
ncbi:hypothetical protein QVG61_03025 [Thiohalobacter sp. IOR34]|uniref:IS66 family insertion sequence element accessory protein TnpA n=1 Tax=Thiohalobacter sp. IOR34 TaxID=3057176 RepID=UPI0025AF4D52|nr:hypothetical protein [Thiohalobacter sp. IOR34]WJW74358.1 hypothetical protein QVG61_07475 [Thiohalobacter sp. IOR34]WJW75563.1 hypothetical protein QVG61_00280 [Thiohalobacter sp. IOR34]WJW76081.1 hypothetical protein QVG61_03025 [Thiohalobacter sp. IOR34]